MFVAKPPTQFLHLVKTNAINYRKHFQKLNEVDEKLCISNDRRELFEKYGHASAIAKIDDTMINDLHYIMVMYNKPLSPRRRIQLRNTIVPLFDTNDNDLISFAKYILDYYECV
jgi:hypothetical protein